MLRQVQTVTFYSCSGVSNVTGLSVFIIYIVSLWGFMETMDCIIYCYSETCPKPGRSVAILLWVDNGWTEPVLLCISLSLMYQDW